MESKILLIQPPAKIVNPPLGLAYLAAVLEKSHFLVKIIDAPALGYQFKQILKEAQEFKPTIIGLTATTPEFPTTLKLATCLKKNLKESLIIIGGCHLTALPEEVMKHHCLDFGIIGEGEKTLIELVFALKKRKKDWQKISGLAFKKGKKLILTPPRPFIKNLDTLPFPAYHLLPPSATYRPTPGSYQNLPFGAIITSRGCPFSCTFCDRRVFGNQVRFRRPEKVVEEITLLVEKYGCREIRIWDDTFNLNPQRIRQICRLILKQNLKFSWTCLGRVNFVDKQTLELMKKAGCWQISYGIESGSQKTLNKIKKGISLEMSKMAVEKTKKAGIEVKCFFMLGVPGETQQTIQQTLEFAKQLDPDIATFSVTIPYPGTEIYRESRKTGELKKTSWKNYLPYQTRKLPFVPKGMTAKEILNYQQKAYKEFYLRPKVFLREVLKIRSLTQLHSKIKGFLSIQTKIPS